MSVGWNTTNFKKKQKRKFRAAAEKKGGRGGGKRLSTEKVFQGISRYSEINKNQEPKVKIKLAELCREYVWVCYCVHFHNVLFLRFKETGPGSRFIW